MEEENKNLNDDWEAEQTVPNETDNMQEESKPINDTEKDFNQFDVQEENNTVAKKNPNDADMVNNNVTPNQNTAPVMNEKSAGNMVHPAPMTQPQNFQSTQPMNNQQHLNPDLQAMLLPDPKGHDSAVCAFIPMCCGWCCMGLCLPCNVCCSDFDSKESHMLRVKEGTVGLKLYLGRFEAYLVPGVYWINPCVYEIRIVSMKAQVFDNLCYKFLTQDNVEIDIKTYIIGKIIDPYTAILKLKDYRLALKGLCGGAVKAVITSSTSHDLLKNSSSLDQQVLKKLGKTASVFG